MVFWYHFLRPHLSNIGFFFFLTFCQIFKRGLSSVIFGVMKPHLDDITKFHPNFDNFNQLIWLFSFSIFGLKRGGGKSFNLHFLVLDSRVSYGSLTYKSLLTTCHSNIDVHTIAMLELDMYALHTQVHFVLLFMA